MSVHYPRIRLQDQDGHVQVREGLSLTFYMRPPHQRIAERVLRTLDVYQRHIGHGVLSLYAGPEGEWRNLDEAGWSLIRRELREEPCPNVALEPSDAGGTHAFLYRGMDLEYLSRMNEPDAMCEVTFWLPTEFLEEKGPEQVRALAIELASLLPLCSGSCGLSFQGGLELVGVNRALTRYWMRYPGIDIPSPHGHSSDIGTRMRGPHWMNFIGQPVLGELGGAERLRARLRTPGTAVQELEDAKVVITLGEWPEAGDLERGDVLPAYRELARVLEPWLYRSRIPMLNRSEEESRRWERRFLD
jgi:hypothetical protein